MTRNEAVAIYQPIRAEIVAITRLAMKDVQRLDLERAAKQLGLWSNGRIAAEDDETATEMIMDVALFEANQRKVRPIDRFLAKRGPTMPDEQRQLAERMARARFSLFHVQRPHPAGGLEMTDLLHGRQDVWLMDMRIDRHIAAGTVIGMRLFDAGPFHAGFGIVAQPDDDTIQMTVGLMETEGRTPFRYPLSATLYADALHGTADEDDEDLREAFAQTLSSFEQRKRKPKR